MARIERTHRPLHLAILTSLLLCMSAGATDIIQTIAGGGNL